MRYIALFITLFFLGCTETQLTKKVIAPSQLSTVQSNVPQIKAHLADGQLYFFQLWSLQGDTLKGAGEIYDADRRKTFSGELSLPLSQIASVEVSETKKGFATSSSPYMASTAISITGGVAFWGLLLILVSFGI